jgi:hypothetical protein
VEHCLKSLGCRLIDAEHDLDRREITGAVMLKNNPDGKHDEVNVLRERVNMGAREDRFGRDTGGHDDDDDEEKTVVRYLYEKPEGRDGMTDTNPKSKYNEANVVRKRVNVRQKQVDLLKVLGYKLIGDEQDPHDGGAASKNIRDNGPGKNKVHEKPEMRAVMGDTNDAVVLNTEYEASIKVHQGRKLNMDEMPETSEMMIESNIDGKDDEINGNKSVIKYSDDTVFENSLDKDPGKDKMKEKDGDMYEKPERKGVMGNGKYILTKDMSRNQKPDRATKSVPAAEIVTAVEACDEGHWVRHILDQVLGVTSFPCLQVSPALGASRWLTSSTCTRSLRRRMRCSRPTPRASTTRTT